MSGDRTLRSAGARFRQALREEKPLQIAGTINAYHARLATASGFRAIYVSGGGVAAGSLGIPDLGISNLDDVLTDVRRITDVCDTPLLVDVDTGFGSSAFNVARTTRSLSFALVRLPKFMVPIANTARSAPPRARGESQRRWV